MKPESSIDELVEALRADLPTPGDEARVRARLAALGVSVGAGVTATTGAAAAPVVKAALPGAQFIAKFATLPLAIKASVLGVVSASAVATPLLLASKPAPQSDDVRSGATRSQPMKPSESRQAPHVDTGREALAAPAELGRSDPARPQAERPLARNEPEGPPSESERARVRERRVASGSPTLNGVARAAQPSPRAEIAPASQDGAPGAEPEATSLSARAFAPALAGGLGPSTTPLEGGSNPSAAPPDGGVSPSAASALTPNPRPDTRAPASSLREETELVDAALLALRGGDRARARALLDVHARRYTEGLLARERERARNRLRTEKTGPSH